VTLYRGLDNMRRVRIDQPADLSPDELGAPAASATTTTAATATQTPQN
jgi:hypothetical protein